MLLHLSGKLPAYAGIYQQLSIQPRLRAECLALLQANPPVWRPHGGLLGTLVRYLESEPCLLDPVRAMADLMFLNRDMYVTLSSVTRHLERFEPSWNIFTNAPISGPSGQMGQLSDKTSNAAQMALADDPPYVDDVGHRRRVLNGWYAARTAYFMPRHDFWAQMWTQVCLVESAAGFHLMKALSSTDSTTQIAHMHMASLATILGEVSSAKAPAEGASVSEVFEGARSIMANIAASFAKAYLGYFCPDLAMAAAPITSGLVRTSFTKEDFHLIAPALRILDAWMTYDASHLGTKILELAKGVRTTFADNSVDAYPIVSYFLPSSSFSRTDLSEDYRDGYQNPQIAHFSPNTTFPNEPRFGLRPDELIKAFIAKTSSFEAVSDRFASAAVAAIGIAALGDSNYAVHGPWYKTLGDRIFQDFLVGDKAVEIETCQGGLSSSGSISITDVWIRPRIPITTVSGLDIGALFELSAASQKGVFDRVTADIRGELSFDPSAVRSAESIKESIYASERSDTHVTYLSTCHAYRSMRPEWPATLWKLWPSSIVAGGSPVTGFASTVRSVMAPDQATIDSLRHFLNDLQTGLRDDAGLSPSLRTLADAFAYIGCLVHVGREALNGTPAVGDQLQSVRRFLDSSVPIPIQFAAKAIEMARAGEVIQGYGVANRIPKAGTFTDAYFARTSVTDIVLMSCLYESQRGTAPELVTDVLFFVPFSYVIRPLSLTTTKDSEVSLSSRANERENLSNYWIPRTNVVPSNVIVIPSRSVILHDQFDVRHLCPNSVPFCSSFLATEVHLLTQGQVGAGSTRSSGLYYWDNSPEVTSTSVIPVVNSLNPAVTPMRGDVLLAANASAESSDGRGVSYSL